MKIVHPTSTGTHTLVWIFHDDDERRMYLSTARNKDAGPIGTVILGAMLAAALVGGVVGNASILLLVLVIIVPFAAQAHRLYVASRFPLTTLRVQCRPGSVRVTENYGEANRWRDRVVFERPASSFQSATWLSGGLFLEIKGIVTGERGITLPMRLFPSQAAIDGFAKWALEHGLAVEGVPPLPGAYER